MAIEIPSKSIYEIKNKKVLDNVYKSIECNYNSIDYVSDALFNMNIRSFANNESGNMQDVFTDNESATFHINTESYTVSYSQTVLGITTNYTDTRSNGYIEISDMQNKTRYENIGVYIIKQSVMETDSGSTDYSLKSSFSIRGEYNSLNDFLNDLPSAKRTNYFGIKIIDDTNFIIFFDIIRKTAATISGTVTFITLNMNFTVNADVIKIDSIAKQGSISPVLSISTNELINDAVEVSNVGNNTSESLIDYIEDEIQYVYEQGLETATIRCSINNYYKYLGTTKEKSIDDDNEEMLFTIGDLVVPMKRTAKGDEPLSMRNGVPKPFRVNEVNIVNNGAVWQELTLIETILGIITGIIAVKGNNISGNAGIVADSTITPTDYFLLGKRVGGQVVGGSILVSKANQQNGAKYAPRTINYYISSDYYMSGIVQESAAQGNGYTLTHPFTITVQGNHINSLTIKFDETKNVYATRLSIDGTEITNNNISVEQSVNDGLATHTIVINALNISSSPVIITSINTNL